MSLSRPIDYLRTLPPPRLVLWCYLLWYLSMARRGPADWVAAASKHSRHMA
jgi:hypothetical protein